MKILQIIDSLNMGGAEKLLLDSIPLYVERGITMDIALLTDNDYPFTKALEAKNCSKIFRLSKGSVYNPALIFKLQKLLKNYDIAHVHLFPAQYWAVFANLLNGSKTKLIFTEHSTSNRRIRNKFFKPIEKFIYNKYDKTVCITSGVQEIIDAHAKVKRENLPIIENGVNIENVINAQALNRNEISPDLKPDDKVIMQVSSMHEPKDQKTLIKSLHHLPSNFKVVLLGDGVLRQDLEEFTKTEELSNRVYFLGRKTNVYEHLKSADYIVLSSKYEGLSLSSIEGMASGKPFIASEVPGLKEIVGGYGVLFPQGDAQTLAKKILSLENDPEMYQKIVEKCQTRAREFDIHRMVDKYIQLYEKLSN
ncbi:glycosyltransferase [Ornithobacterium rhinotracheale]|uniref:glycosyltransferase n=1 Tax=Ornithobacterium rhinotracheale TaxID=28251 RepID=UPI00129C3E48|nr:glycosyltransferase [Ornithobacterium rhinotracheale]MRI62405.1 glycosyltransferase [Ornithobacterium rhinotracheale]